MAVDMAAMLSQPIADVGEELDDFSFFLTAAHTIGDGMALHAFANAFFCLLGSSKSVQELHGLLVAEWEKRWASPLSDRVCFAFMRLSSQPLTSCPLEAEGTASEL